MTPDDELTILIDSMRGYGYSESDIADAIRRPGYWREELAQAITDLTGRVS